MRIEIIAELAQGFEGNPEQSRLLLKAAAAAGADAAKYQLVYADELGTPDYKHYELFRTLEMPDSVWEELAGSARALGIELHLDVFGSRSLELAERIGAAAVKLHPTDVSNAGLLAEVAGSSVDRVLLGAGGAFAGELAEALRILSGKQVVVLLGFQGYPTPTETNQIARVAGLAARLRREHPRAAIGFADHADPGSPLRYALAATAIGAGATVLEKHLTLGKVMKLEDHESALNPDEFTEFCVVARQCAEAVGEFADTEEFGMSEPEQTYRANIRRHVVTRHALSAGSELSPADLALKRTAAENALTSLESTYGKTLVRDLAGNSPVAAGDVR